MLCLEGEYRDVTCDPWSSNFAGICHKLVKSMKSAFHLDIQYVQTYYIYNIVAYYIFINLCSKFQNIALLLL